MLKYKLTVLLCCVVHTAALASASTQATPLYWHNGEVKMPLYRHPDLCALPANNAKRPSTRMPSALTADQSVGQRGHWRIYPRPANGGAAVRSTSSGRCLPFYSSAPDWRKSALHVQSSGTIVIFKSSLSVQQISQWFAKEKYKSKQLSSEHAYLIEGVDGEAAIQLANQIFTSGVAEVAQPNWNTEISAR